MVHVRWAVACFSAAVPFFIVFVLGCATVPLKTASFEDQFKPATVTDNAVIRGGKGQVDPNPEVESWYRLGPEDTIRVAVWENKELTMDVVVRPDGKISLPLIQDVQAESITANELAEIITKKLSTYVKDPRVSVIVLQVNAPKYYVIGNVVKPGVYILRGPTSVLQALALSGGFTQFASLRSIRLIRNTQGKQEIRQINYNNVIDEGGEGNYMLKSGDTIVVP